MFWDQKTECMSRDEMVAFQTESLKATIKNTYEKIGFYKKKFDEKGVLPQDVKNLKDIALLPFTEKSDIRDNYPFGFCAVPPSDIVRVHASSGTTGQPTPVYYTKNDLEKWLNSMSRNLYTAGVRQDDVCQVAFRYSLFTGAFGHHQAAERIGAMVVPTSSGQTERQILMMKDFQTTVLHCTPSYAITIAEKIIEMGIDKNRLALRLGVHGAEPMSEELRREIEQKLGTIAIRDYGLTEVGGTGVSVECPEKSGYHINEDYYYPEIIDPETSKPLPYGELGELIFTPLQNEAFPLIRYRTRDITYLNIEKCNCGRTLIRHGEIKGRTDDMLIIGGVNFFPSQLESVLLDFEEIEPHYLIRLSKKGRLDHVAADVETNPQFWTDAPKEAISELVNKIQKKVRDIIGFRMEINIVEPFTIARSEGKAKRVQDNR